MVISAKGSKKLPNIQLATSLISELLTDYSYGIAVPVLAQFLILSLTFTWYSGTKKRKEKKKASQALAIRVFSVWVCDEVR